MAELHANQIIGKDAIKEHGSLEFEIRDFKNPAHRGLLKESIVAKNKAWTGWWFPSRDREMFDMGNQVSPLGAYDEMLRFIRFYQKGTTRYRSNALSPLYRKWSADDAKAYFDIMDNFKNNQGIQNTADFEEKYIYAHNEESWDGVCEGVAFAATLEKEPTQCRQFKTLDGDTITLTPFHQKALLAKKYDFVSEGINYYGNKFVNEPWNTNIAGPEHDYSDISPVQLHRLLHFYMRDQKKNIILDYDAGYPVWNVAVFGYDSFVRDEGNGILKVKTNLYYSDPFNRDELIGYAGDYNLNYTGTHEEILELYYELEYVRSGTKYKIVSSRWTEGVGVKSFVYHPDYVLVPDAAKVVPRSAGDVINPAIVDFMLNDLKIVPCPGE